MTEAEFEAIKQDRSKRILGDISWQDDEDHSPSAEFHCEIVSDAGYPLFIRGSFNPLAEALTFAVIHRTAGRVYALDIGKDHHNPSCNKVGDRHLHIWNDLSSSLSEKVH